MAAETEFHEDEHPRKPGFPEWHDNPPQWEQAKLFVAQATLALKVTDKSTPLRDNCLYNLEQAIKALKGLT